MINDTAIQYLPERIDDLNQQAWNFRVNDFQPGITDRIFGTFNYRPPPEIKFGLKELDEEKKQSFWYLIRSPFMNFKRISSEELKKQNYFP